MALLGELHTKALLALKHRRIPGNLHLNEPNPDVAWDELGVRIPTRSMPWPPGASELAGVSSFGITGTNAHAILAGPPQAPGGLAALSAFELAFQQELARHGPGLPAGGRGLGDLDAFTAGRVRNGRHVARLPTRRSAGSE